MRRSAGFVGRKTQHGRKRDVDTLCVFFVLDLKPHAEAQDLNPGHILWFANHASV